MRKYTDVKNTLVNLGYNEKGVNYHMEVDTRSDKDVQPINIMLTCGRLYYIFDEDNELKLIHGLNIHREEVVNVKNYLILKHELESDDNRKTTNNLNIMKAYYLLIKQLFPKVKLSKETELVIDKEDTTDNEDTEQFNSKLPVVDYSGKLYVDYTRITVPIEGINDEGEIVKANKNVGAIVVMTYSDSLGNIFSKSLENEEDSSYTHLIDELFYEVNKEIKTILDNEEKRFNFLGIDILSHLLSERHFDTEDRNNMFVKDKGIVRLVNKLNYRIKYKAKRKEKSKMYADLMKDTQCLKSMLDEYSNYDVTERSNNTIILYNKSDNNKRDFRQLNIKVLKDAKIPYKQYKNYIAVNVMGLNFWQIMALGKTNITKEQMFKSNKRYYM